MRCENCGEKIGKNARFCSNCGAEIQRKKKVNIGILSILIIIVIAVAAGILLLKPEKTKTPEEIPVLMANNEKLESVTSEEKAEEIEVEQEKTEDVQFSELKRPMSENDTKEITKNTNSELILFSDRCEFYVGQEEMMQLTLKVQEDLHERIVVKDETGQEKASFLVEGKGDYHTTLTIRGNDTKTGRLQAVSERQNSNEILYYIQPEITIEMVSELADIAEDLEDFVKSRGRSASYYDKATLQAVQNRLYNNENISAVRVYDDCLIYVTEDGLVGSYGMGQYEEGYAGRIDLQNAYAEHKEGKNLVNEYVISDLTLTNTNFMMLSPEMEGDEFDEMREVAEKALNRLSDKVGGGTVYVAEGLNAAAYLADGRYTDQGLVLFSTHGNLIPRQNGSQMLYFQLGNLRKGFFDTLVDNTQEGNTWGNLDSFFNGEDTSWWNSLFGGNTGNVTPENYRLVYDVTPDSENIYTVRGTTNFIAQGLGDHIFDNTVVYFGVCYAASDTELIRLLEQHGASAFIGTRDTFNIMYIGVLMEELAEVLGANTGISQADQMKGITDLSCAFRLNDREAFNDMFYRYMADSNDNAAYEDVVMVKDEKMVPTTDRKEDGSTIKISPREYAGILWDHMQEKNNDFIAQVYSFHNEDFSMTGEGDFSGKVVTPKGDVLEGAQVTVYRWLNHRFEKIDSMTTDKDGNYRFTKVPYGMCVAEAELGDAREFISLEFSKNTVTIDNIVLDLVGIIGTVLDEEGGYPIDAASVQYTLANSTSGALTDVNGRFCTLQMQPGTYTIVATKEGYEDSKPLTVTVENGELYILPEPILLKRAPVEDDTWGAANGMYGPVEYEYDENGNVIQMSLINGENGKLYRRLVYDYYYDYGYEGNYYIETYGPNNIQLYSLTQRRNEEGYLLESWGFDLYKMQESSYQLYTGGSWEQIETETLSDYRNGADNYWICHYNYNGLERKDIYFKDGAKIACELYEYESDSAGPTMTYLDGGMTQGYYSSVLDKEGRVIEYWDKHKELDYPTWTFEYDAKGTLLKKTKYKEKNEIYEQQEFVYGNNGRLTKCFYRSAFSYGPAMEYYFEYDHGYLVYREGIESSIGLGDIGCMEYEYYDNGVVKRLTCYGCFENPTVEDLEYIFSFDENGKLKARIVYGYTYNSDDGRQPHHGDTFRDTRILTLFDMNGKEKYKYIWIEETDKAEGQLEHYGFDVSGTRTRVITEEFHEAIPSATELEDMKKMER